MNNDEIVSTCEKDWLTGAMCGGFGNFAMTPRNKTYCEDMFNIIFDGLLRFTTSSGFNIDMKYSYSLIQPKPYLENTQLRAQVLNDLDAHCLKIIHDTKKNAINAHADVVSMSFLVPTR